MPREPHGGIDHGLARGGGPGRPPQHLLDDADPALCDPAPAAREAADQYDAPVRIQPCRVDDVGGGQALVEGDRVGVVVDLHPVLAPVGTGQLPLLPVGEPPVLLVPLLVEEAALNAQLSALGAVENLPDREPGPGPGHGEPTARILLRSTRAHYRTGSRAMRRSREQRPGRSPHGSARHR